MASSGKNMDLNYEPDSPEPPPKRPRHKKVMTRPSPPSSPESSPASSPCHSPEYDLQEDGPSTLMVQPATIPRFQGYVPPSINFFLQNNPVHIHSNSVIILCIRDDGYTLTNGFMTVTHENFDMDHILTALLQLRVGYVLCTDSATQKHLDGMLRLLFEYHPAKLLKTGVLKQDEFGTCPFCKVACHRYQAMMGMSFFQRYKMDLLEH